MPERTPRRRNPRISIVVSPATHDALAAIARRDEVSIARVANRAIREWLASQPAERRD